MRIVLVQPDREAAGRMRAEFADFGYEVVSAGSKAAAAPQKLDDVRAHAVVVCLDSKPAEALDLLGAVVQAKGLRSCPVLFAGGTEDALAAAEQAYPRASFTRMEELHTSLASVRS